MDDDLPPVRDRLEEVGALSLGDDPPPDAVEAVLRRWTSTLDGADELRVGLERDALADLPGIKAGRVDDALASQPDGGADGAQEVEGPDADELYERGREILEAEDQLDQFRASLDRLGYAGDDTEAAELGHVALCSRALERPIGLAYFGPSAAGKTYTVEAAARHHPDDAIHDVSAMSERYLAYADFPTEHRYVSIAEASALHNDGVGATIIRELSWNRRLRYGTVVRTEEGPQAKTIEKPGPTGLITTSTKPLDEEIATRLIAVHITDSPDQTREVMHALAREAAGEREEEPDLDPWRAASDWLRLAGNREVVVPYAEYIAHEVPAESVRMRRDFEQVLTVVRALAFMHQRKRPRDDVGRVVATKEDYGNAYRLLSGTMAVTIDQVSEAVRETVQAVEELSEGKSPSDGVSYPELADELGLSRSGAWRRARRALRDGYLANAEERDGYPAKLVVADPLPDDRAVLPEPESIPSENPPKHTQRLKASGESAELTGDTGVEAPDSMEGGIDSIPPGDCEGALKGPTARAGGENPEGIELLSGDQGGREERGAGQDGCRDCGAPIGPSVERCAECKHGGDDS